MQKTSSTRVYDKKRNVPQGNMLTEEAQSKSPSLSGKAYSVYKDLSGCRRTRGKWYYWMPMTLTSMEPY